MWTDADFGIEAPAEAGEAADAGDDEPEEYLGQINCGAHNLSAWGASIVLSR